MSATPSAGSIEFQESGQGPTIIFAPGSCSTGAAWRPTIAQLSGARAITTSLCGYGGTAERRCTEDQSIASVAGALEDVIFRAGEPVHLVGHSFGGLVGLAVALRGKTRLLSLTIFEAPAVGMLNNDRYRSLFLEVQRMTSAYAADFDAGTPDAIAAMIDFYGGPGCWAAMPRAVQDYAMHTTAVNLRDWQNAYAFAPGEELINLAGLPLSVVVGERSHPAIVKANMLIAQAAPGATYKEIPGAAHFMVVSHPTESAAIIKRTVAELI